jgi:hypothetical protein
MSSACCLGHGFRLPVGGEVGIVDDLHAGRRFQAALAAAPQQAFHFGPWQLLQQHASVGWYAGVMVAAAARQAGHHGVGTANDADYLGTGSTVDFQ